MDHEQFLLQEVDRRLERLELIAEKLVKLCEKILHLEEPRLSSIGLQFTLLTAAPRGTPMSFVAGPITLVLAGQQAAVSVLGFDQFGNPFTGTIPTPTFTSDDTADAIAELTTDVNGVEVVTAVANGVANITVTLSTTDANGNPVTLTDTEAVTVAIPVVPPPAPVLSSIKVAFDSTYVPPTTPAANLKKK